MRGLAQLARRLVALNPDAAVLDLSSLSQDLPAEEAVRGPTPTNGHPLVKDVAEDGDVAVDPSPQVFLASLRQNRGNVRKSATALGISRGRAYRIIEKMGSVDLEGFRQPASPIPPSDE